MREIEAIYPIVTDEQDTVMYAVNFGKDLGFMLLSGDKGTFPIAYYDESDWKAQNGNNYNRTRQMFVDLYPDHDDMR